MVDIVSLGYDVETSQVAKGDAALDKLTASTLNADAASKKLGASSLQMGTRMGTAAQQANNLNRASTGAGRQGLRNMGLQLNQVAQQGAVTGNYLQALTIQLPDLLLGFGGVGIAVGILAGVLGPLALSFLDNSDGVDDLDGAMDALASTTDNLQRSLDLTRLTNEELVETYGEGAQKVREFAIWQAELNAAQAASRLRDQVDILGDTINAFTTAQDAGRNYLNTLARIEDEFGVTNSQARQFETILGDLGNSLTFQGQQDALSNILNFLEDNNVELSKVPPELQRALSEMITLSVETERARALMAQLAGEAASVNVGVPLFEQNLSDGLLPPVESEEDKKKRRGRAKKDPYEDNLNRLVDSLRTERETLEIWYAESELLLDDHRARKLLGEEEHKEALLALEEEYQSRNSKLGDTGYNQQLSAASAFFGSVASVAQSGNDRLARIARAAGAVEATINAYRGAAQALADPTVPFYAKAAAYAATLATGLGAVAAIKSSSDGGTATAAGGAAAGVSATETQAAPEDPRRVLLDFNGSPSWVEDMFADITSRIQENSDLGVIYEVAR